MKIVLILKGITTGKNARCYLSCNTAKMVVYSQPISLKRCIKEDMKTHSSEGGRFLPQPVSFGWSMRCPGE